MTFNVPLGLNLIAHLLDHVIIKVGAYKDSNQMGIYEFQQ